MTSALLESVGAIPAGHVDLRGCAVGIPLRGRNGVIRAFAMVDAADAHRLSRLKLFLHGRYPTRYAGVAETGGYEKRALHRELMGNPDGEVDHRNRDVLDNRRANLRVATHMENAQNQGGHVDAFYSKHRGVSYNKRRRKWIARARANGVDHWLGCHSTEEAAADAAARFREHNMPYSEEASS